MCPLFPASSAKAPATREGKARKGRREPDLLSFRIRLFETNFLGPQGCLNKKHTCGEPTAGVAHTFPGGIQGPGRGVTAHQRAPPEKATGPARLAHPGFGLEHPGNGPKTGKQVEAPTGNAGGEPAEELYESHLKTMNNVSLGMVDRSDIFYKTIQAELSTATGDLTSIVDVGNVQRQ